MVLTENYLANDWCRYELQAALRESALDKTHKIIAVILDPKCLAELDAEMRSLLVGSSSSSSSPYQQSGQLMQLDGLSTPPSNDLIATLNQNSMTGSKQLISTQAANRIATNKVSFLKYNDRKFWTKMKHSMPGPRLPTQTLTLTTKN